jgi:hypothetical protein
LDTPEYQQRIKARVENAVRHGTAMEALPSAYSISNEEESQGFDLNSIERKHFDTTDPDYQ